MDNYTMFSDLNEDDYQTMVFTVNEQEESDDLFVKLETEITVQVIEKPDKSAAKSKGRAPAGAAKRLNEMKLNAIRLRTGECIQFGPQVLITPIRKLVNGSCGCGECENNGDDSED